MQAKDHASLLDSSIKTTFVQGRPATTCAVAATLHCSTLLICHVDGAGNIENLPFSANSFDCVVDTFSLCVFGNPARALEEVARVLRKGGLALLAEHSRADFGPLAWWQDVTVAPVTAAGKGCVWNQDVRQLLQGAGLKPVQFRPMLGGLIRYIVATHDPELPGSGA